MSSNVIRRPERRVFGRDITNINALGEDKSMKHEQKHYSLNLKYIPNVKPVENVAKIQDKHQDPINQYRQDILQHMLSLQTKQKPSINDQITPHMREVLIDWMIDVHANFKLKQQTLHLALSYLNHFEAKSQAYTKDTYQLVGITCLWIASKYEEIYPPRMSNYTEVTANTYTLGQMRRMEERIFEKLEFNLNHITTLALLEAATSMNADQKEFSELDKKSIAYAKYILELVALEGEVSHKNEPSKIVAAAIMVCNQVFKTKFAYSGLQNLKKYSEKELLDCYKEIIMLLRSGKTFGDAVKRKFQSEEYFKVGKLKIQLKVDEKESGQRE